MDIVAWVELALAVIVILCGQAVLWTKFKTLSESKMSNLQEAVSRHDECINVIKARYGTFITVPQHDKMQGDCQKGIYNDINNIGRSLNLVRTDVSKTDEKLDNISLALVELRSDLKHMGAVK